MESEELLRDAFGLNSYESKLYIALLGRGMKAGEAAQASGVPQSRTYDTLRSLEQKGFVVESDGVYQSATPSAALGSRIAKYVVDFEARLAGRQSAMRTIVAELEPLARPRDGEQEPVMLKGLESIAAAFLEVLRESEDAFLLVRKGIEAKTAFLGVLGQAGRKPRRVKLMVPTSQRLTRVELREAEKRGLEVRRSEGVLLDMMAGDRGGVIIGVPARGRDESFAAVAIWVRSPSFALSVMESLEQQWKAARPLRRNP
ncbi:MAG: TrmB family transcriptional regulator [Nitrososphaerota archaeon]|nr:TrmB family transcriptional regulator [Nitrososphaerota archaeon]MDG7025660.1 TrmB family transcriptional regulator [Nitrososphaerota archaeon]